LAPLVGAFSEAKPRLRVGVNLWRIEMERIRLARVVGRAAFVIALAVAGRAHAANIVVNSFGDEDMVVNGNCTFREAVQALNTSAVVDQCAAGNGSNDTITLPWGTIAITVNKHINVLKRVVINGVGYNFSSIDFQNLGVTINIGDGGLNKPGTALQYVTLQNAGQTAVKVNSGSSIAILRARLYNNKGGVSFPGAIAVASGAFASVTSSVVDNNAGFSGGAIRSNGLLSIASSTFIRNQGEHGGTVSTGSGGETTIFNSTFARNNGHIEGAAIFSDGGTTTLQGVTIAYNDSGTHPNNCNAPNAHCGAIYNRSPGVVNISGSVVANNTAAGQAYNMDCSGLDPDTSVTAPYAPAGINSQGFNLLGNFSGNGCPKTATDLNPQNPQLISSGATHEPTEEGGGTLAYLPQAASPLLNVIPGGNSLCAAADQRSVQRGKDGSGFCDVGAIERSTALLVLDNTGGQTMGDMAVQSMLEDLGFVVTIADDDAVTSAMASGKQMVAISASVTSGKVNTKFRDVTNGVVCMENALFDDMKMTGTAAGQFGTSGNQFDLLFQGELAQIMGFGGTNSITYTPVDIGQTFVWGKPGAAAVVQARLASDSTKAGIFTYAKGAALVGGGNAAGVRVGLYTQDDTVMGLNDGGWTLEHEALLLGAR
jgi:CSLREA domain-containing protein